MTADCTQAPGGAFWYPIVQLYQDPGTDCAVGAAVSYQNTNSSHKQFTPAVLSQFAITIPRLTATYAKHVRLVHTAVLSQVLVLGVTLQTSRSLCSCSH